METILSMQIPSGSEIAPNIAQASQFVSQPSLLPSFTAPRPANFVLIWVNYARKMALLLSLRI